MSNLQRAIRKVETAIDSAITPAGIYIEPVLEAARKYANPDIDTMRRTVIVAGIELQNQERNITWPEWANELLAALGVTEDE